MKPEILTKAEALGFKTFTGNYDLNLIGVRSDIQAPNKFNDKFYIVYQENGKWVTHVFPFTSLAGKYWLNNPSRAAGCAILVHDKQYLGAYKLGLHRGYEALQQVGKVDVWRDDNRDDIADYDCPVESGWFGINIHRASRDRTSTDINRHSAGCQVLASPSHFSLLIGLVKKQKLAGLGDVCSYTLIKQSTLEGSPSCPVEESKSPSKSRKQSSPSSSKPSKKSTKPRARKAKAAPKSRKKKGEK